MTKYHIFGDTGGHHRQLKIGLEAIGFNSDTYELPEDVVVVHCGDLLHKGPNSAAVIFMVDRIMKKNPGQWVQLLGNHEYQYLGGIPFWREKIDPDAITVLKNWYLNGDAKNAFALPSDAVFSDITATRGVKIPKKSVIFTHAGITRQYWEKYLGSSMDVAHIVEELNSFSPDFIGTPGAIIGGRHTSTYPAGPIWALGVEEVWESWKDETRIPFIQVHGHTAPFSHRLGRWRANTVKDFKKASKVHMMKRAVITAVSDAIQVALDPDYDKAATDGPQPSILITVG